MQDNDALSVNQDQLVNAWQQTLQTTLQEGDQAQVKPDAANPSAMRITIDAAGRQMYSFDFQCAYVDTREVKVDLVDVERDGISVDERTQIIQEMAQTYTRNIHECAQALHELTHDQQQ